MKSWFLKEAHIEGIGDVTFDTEVVVTHGRTIFGIISAKQFFEEIVIPNLDDFYKDSLNVRKAINSCISLYHLSDWHWKDNNEKKFKRESIPNSTALESIANGSKHFNTQKTYQSGEIDGSYTEKALTLNCGDKVLILKDMLKDIQKFWEREFS